MDEWESIISVDTSGFHTVGLKSDGTVVSTVPGKDPNRVSDVGKWENIVAISAGQNFTVGLQADGTVVATGSNEDGECNVSAWRDIIAISAGYRRTIGLRKDGTVVATGENKYGECDVADWRDIVSIYAGARQTIGIKENHVSQLLLLLCFLHPIQTQCRHGKHQVTVHRSSPKRPGRCAAVLLPASGNSHMSFSGILRVSVYTVYRHSQGILPHCIHIWCGCAGRV